METRFRSLLRRHGFIVSFVVLNSLMGVGVGLAKIATPLFAIQLGADETWLGLIAGAQSAGIVLFGLPTGFLVDRYGPAGLFVVGSLCAGALYALVPLLPTVPFLLLFTFAISFFMPLRFVPLGTVFLEQLAVLGEAKAGWARGSHMAGSTLFGPAIAAALLAAAGYTQTYWTIAGLFVVTMLFSRIVFAQSGRPVTKRALSWSAVAEQLGSLRRDADLQGACLVDFVGQAVMIFYVFFIVVIAVAQLGMSAEQASGLVGAQGFAYVVGLLTLGPFANRLGQQQAYVCSFATIALALGVLGMSSGARALWVGALLLGAGLGLLQIVNLVRFARIGARVGRGKIAGLNALVGPAGGMVGSVVGGSLGRAVGLQNVFFVFIPLIAWLHWRVQLARPALAIETFSE